MTVVRGLFCLWGMFNVHESEMPRTEGDLKSQPGSQPLSEALSESQL